MRLEGYAARWDLLDRRAGALPCRDLPTAFDQCLRDNPLISLQLNHAEAPLFVTIWDHGLIVLPDAYGVWFGVTLTGTARLRVRGLFEQGAIRGISIHLYLVTTRIGTYRGEKVREVVEGVITEISLVTGNGKPAVAGLEKYLTLDGQPYRFARREKVTA